MADLQAFIDRLLATAPGAPKSIQLEVDTEGDVAGLFEVLLTILTGILKAWYPPPISMSNLTDQDHQQLRALFASFGIRLQVASDPIPAVLRINNRAYEHKHRLEDMQFQMTSTDTLFTVQFAFL